MFQVKYYKDYQHNYLIIKCKEEKGIGSYQRKMITSNTIKGLLICQERHINGDTLLYYEITSKQSLESIYASKSVNLEVLQDFFLQLKLVYDILQKYLLNESSLVLSPEYIYRDMESGDFFFLYYPEEENNTFIHLMDFFAEKVSEEDTEAVETVYKIADLIHKEQFVIDEVLEWFQDYSNVSGQPPVMQKNMPEYEETYTDSEEDMYEKNREENTSGKRNLSKWTLFPAILGVVMAGSLLYFMYGYNLTEMGKILLVIGWCIVIFLLGIAILGYWAGNREKMDIEMPEEKAKEFPGEIMNYERTFRNTKAAECGNTVYIPWIDNCENRLYGVDKGNKYHIDLGKLPLTVGKMAGAVDMVINETGISRMHAKFSKTGNKIYITDLNSTNGTFKNGLRLEPNASEMIEPGDEIRLGKLKFIYR